MTEIDVDSKISLQILPKTYGENRFRMYDMNEIDDGEEDQSSNNVKG